MCLRVGMDELSEATLPALFPSAKTDLMLPDVVRADLASQPTAGGRRLAHQPVGVSRDRPADM
jgi:hypothetical protein